MSTSEIAKLEILIGIFLSVLVLISYWGVLENDFINFDDPLSVTENLRLQRGLSRETVIWALTSTHTGNWHPLTWLSLLLDRELFGMKAAGYHWTSVILHMLSGLVLFFGLRRMTALPWQSGLVAGLFLIHPLHVESVAWVAERKDVLSGLFWMLGIWSYARYAERPGIHRYLWVVVFFVCGLSSKPMVVTFPFVLLLLDWWPLGRSVKEKSNWARLLWEKIPLFILSAVGSIITYLIQKDHNAVSSLSAIPLWDRLANTTVSYAAYLGKSFWPTGLSVFYPYHGPPSFGYFVSALVLLILMTVLSLLLHRRQPYILTGWLWYLGTLVPVIGFVPVGSQAMADRYTYLPLVGIFIIVVWCVTDLLNGRRERQAIWVFVSAPLLVVLVFLTQIQVGYWRNSTTLFGHTLQNTERNFIAHELLAHDMVRAGNPTGAENHYREAIRIRPAFKQAYNGLGHLLMIQGRQDEASRLLEKTLQIDPTFVPAIKNLGDVRMRQGRIDDAIPLYQKALLLHKEDPELLNNYGVALFFKGDVEEAVLKIRSALYLKPDYAEARDNLRKILERSEASEAK